MPLSRANASSRERGKKLVNVSRIPIDFARATAISLHRLKLRNSNQIRGRGPLQPFVSPYIPPLSEHGCVPTRNRTGATSARRRTPRRRGTRGGGIQMADELRKSSRKARSTLRRTTCTRNQQPTASRRSPPPAETPGGINSTTLGTVELVACVLWRINHSHPFINGNGRTARAVWYLVLCMKSGGLLPGNEILPELLRRNGTRDRYRSALQEADGDNPAPLVELVRELVATQIASGNPAPAAQ